MPNSERMKIKTGSSKIRPRPISTIKIRLKYSLMLISGLTGPS